MTKVFSISELASQFELSRSTLLYYDRIGLLKPSGRRGADYRFYTSREFKKLEKICHYRQAGLTIKEVSILLEAKGKPAARVIEKRIHATGNDIVRMRHQQRLLSNMLKQVVSGQATCVVDKKMWVEMLRSAGVDDAAMKRWHAEFEHRAPDGHQEFLVSLGIPSEEIAQIREWSRRAWKN